MPTFPVHRLALILPTLLLCVTLAHLLALQWATGPAPLALQAMPEPIFARVLLPQATPQPLVTQPQAAQRNKAASQPTPADVASVQASVAPEQVASESVAQPLAEPLAQTPTQPQAAAPVTEAATPTQPSASDATTPAPPPADSWPPNTRLTYVLSGNYRGDFFGSAKVQWQRQDERYQVQLDLRIALFIHLTLTSQGQANSTGLVPNFYEEVRPGRRMQVSMSAQEVRLNDGQTLTTPEGVQDTASQFVELAHRFATGRDTLKVGGQVSLWLARPNGVDLWTYDIVAEDTLQTAKLGPLQAFRLKPRPIAKPRGTIVAEMWFAPSLQYLPVRVLVTQGDGSYVDLMVEKIEQGPTAPKQ